MTGIMPHIIVMGMPQLIICIMVSQHILSISMLIAPLGIMVQIMF
jgi:hypothetical protein